MRVCEIIDEYRASLGAVGYLFYYEKAKKFHIEISEGLTFCDAPPIIDYYVEHGIDNIDFDRSYMWVNQRIVPRDRQNIGQILRDAGMKEYDEFKLLLMCEGRCSQDECAVHEIMLSEIPDYITERQQRRVESVAPLSGQRLLVFFRDGKTFICDVREIVGDDRRFGLILKSNDVFENVKVLEGGYGVGWGAQNDICDYVLRENGLEIGFHLDDLKVYIEKEIYDTAQAVNRLNCTRQNIDDLVRRGKLKPVKTGARNKLFMRSEVEKRLW